MMRYYGYSYDTLDLCKVGDELDDLRDRQDSEEEADALDKDEVERLRELEKLADELGVHDLSRCNKQLIADHSFADYARQEAEDIHPEIRNEGWPFDCIDWEQAAEGLQCDYTSIEFEGLTYWYRS